MWGRGKNHEKDAIVFIYIIFIFLFDVLGSGQLCIFCERAILCKARDPSKYKAVSKLVLLKSKKQHKPTKMLKYLQLAHNL